MAALPVPGTLASGAALRRKARKRSRHHRYSAEFLYFLADGIPAYHSTLLGSFEGAAAVDNVLQIVCLAGRRLRNR